MYYSMLRDFKQEERNKMKRNLFLRTDILPGEIPIMFNNKNLYYPFTEKKIKDTYIENLINKDTTIPYYFHIPKSNGKFRKISLLHPIAQLQAFSYIIRYEQMITSFCSRSSFSVRSPLKRNIAKYNIDKVKEKKIKRLYDEFSFSKETKITSDEDEILFLNYFSYKKYKHISQLYDSIKFKRAKYKYNYFIKLDIQNFFPSIYTHSLAWAILGDKSIAKKTIGDKTSFANATDIICQKINFNETNGLIIGPEFSRVMSELLLTQVDAILLKDLALEKGKSINKDYIIYRYIDDYFIFAKDISTTNEIEEKLDSLLEEYNLHLNTGKKDIQTRPFKMYSTPIVELKQSLKSFRLDKLFTSFELKNNKLEKNTLEETVFIYGKKIHWNELFTKVERIIYENKSSSQKVVNYFLQAIRSSIDYDGGRPWGIINSLEIITSIYSLDINNDSTKHLIAIAAKVNIKCNNLLITEQKNKEELNSEDDNFPEKLKNINEIINNINIVKENVFQSLYFSMKNNFEKMEVMYDLLILFKTFDKPLNPQFLSKIIQDFPKSYFVLCSVGYYIQNEKLNGIDHRYLTVGIKLEKTIDNIKNNYASKGSKNNILEGEYFYIMNDFSFYPGFKPSKREKYRKKIKKDYSLMEPSNENEKESFAFIWESITQRSYFEWNQTTNTFIRKIAKKSSNIYRNKLVKDYTF